MVRAEAFASLTSTARFCKVAAAETHPLSLRREEPPMKTTLAFNVSALTWPSLQFCFSPHLYAE
jgi:hypothetical protein